MNDFTKEELEELLNGYQLHKYNNRHNWPSLDLCKKLQSLIDNYCEHSDASIDIGEAPVVCNTCGKVVA